VTERAGIATIKRRQKTVLVESGIRSVLAVVAGLTLRLLLHYIFNQALAPLKAMQLQQEQ
jgi:hypothetical protein